MKTAICVDKIPFVVFTRDIYRTPPLLRGLKYPGINKLAPAGLQENYRSQTTGTRE